MSGNKSQESGINSIAAVVVTYNRKKLLWKCIEKVLNQKDISCDVLVIDNASTDGTQDMIKEQFSCERVHYYNTGANLGGAGGFQYGIKKAVLSGYEYIWIMDDDTLPSDTALKELIKAGEKLNGKWGFLSSVAYWTDGSICKANEQKINIFQRIKIEQYLSNVVEVQMASFVSLLIKAGDVERVGLPFKEYFIWTDDYEYTGRISKLQKGYVVKSSIVCHAMKKHMRVNLAREGGGRIERYEYLFRNDVHCYRQYGLKGWTYILLKDCYNIWNIICHSKGNRVEKIKIVVRGFKKGLIFKPEIERIENGEESSFKI